MKSSEALKKARKLIESGKQTFICHALKAVRGQNTLVYSRIHEAVPGAVSMWLKMNHPSFPRWEAFVSPAVFAETMREYRLTWIDWLIPQYEEIGD